jgi:hypothetical protein
MKETPSFFTLRNLRSVATWYAKRARTGGRDLSDLRTDEQLRQWRDIQTKTWKKRDDHE